MSHLKKFWSTYLAVVAVIGPYLPILHTIVNGFWATHAVLAGKVLAVLAAVTHWLPSPTNAQKA